MDGYQVVTTGFVDNGVAKKKRFKIILAMLVVLALLAVGILVFVLNQQEEKEKVVVKTYTLAEVQEAANRYANFLVRGKKDDTSFDDETVLYGETKLNKVLVDEVDVEERNDFLKKEKKLSNALIKKMNNINDKNSIPDLKEKIDILQDLHVEVQILGASIGMKYDEKDYLKAYQAGKADGVWKEMIKPYEDAKLYHDLLYVGLEDLEDGGEYINYREIATETEIILADFYTAILNYSDAVASILDLYSEKDCIGVNGMRVYCVEAADLTKAGEIIREEKATYLQDILDNREKLRENSALVLQDTVREINTI